MNLDSSSGRNAISELPTNRSKYVQQSAHLLHPFSAGPNTSRRPPIPTLLSLKPDMLPGQELLSSTTALTSSTTSNTVGQIPLSLTTPAMGTIKSSAVNTPNSLGFHSIHLKANTTSATTTPHASYSNNKQKSTHSDFDHQLFEGFQSSDSSRQLQQQQQQPPPHNTFRRNYSAFNKSSSHNFTGDQQSNDVFYDFLQPPNQLVQQSRTIDDQGMIDSDSTDQIYNRSSCYSSSNPSHDQPPRKRHYLEDLPPQPLIEKPYSLVPDMIFGWIPKIQVSGSIPLNFKNDVIDNIIRELTTKQQNQITETQLSPHHLLCYVGFRPATSLEMHEKFAATSQQNSNSTEKTAGGYSFKFDSALLKEVLPHLQLKREPKNQQDIPKRIEGNNPCFAKRKDILKFDSMFESGNLDLAVKVASSSGGSYEEDVDLNGLTNQYTKKNVVDEYDLFMRVDSNTRGHFQWYYFVVSNTRKNQTVKFNVCNFYKKKSLYSRGMKPYVSSEKERMKNGVGTSNEEVEDELGFEESFVQSGTNVRYQQQKYRYRFLYGENDEGDDGDDEDDDEPIIQSTKSMQPFCLSFEYEFQHDDDRVSFAFCVPYTYSRLQKFLKRSLSLYSQDCLTEEKLCQTLSGIDVPLLTITDKSESGIDVNKKQVVLLSSRIHPGESNSSWIMHGILKFLLGSSVQAIQLRKSTIFKVIPMLNPDGVILGNYRTGLAGRDLNRVFQSRDKVLFPVVIAMKELVHQLKLTYGKRLSTFMDLHGHSIKKNAFVYGPEFPIYDAKYFQCRALPKLIADATEMFRFHSSIFKISRGKRNTGRAVLFRQLNIPMSYTLEASNGTYGDEKPFNSAQYMSIGVHIIKAISIYFNTMFAHEAAVAQSKGKSKKIIAELPRKEEETDNNNINNNNANEVENEDENPVQKLRKQSKSLKEKEKKRKKSKSSKAKMSDDLNAMAIVSDSPFSDLFKGQLTSRKSNLGGGNQSDNYEKAHESDDYSEGGSDSESSDEDYDKKDLQKLRENIESNQRTIRELAKSKSASNRFSKTFYAPNSTTASNSNTSTISSKRQTSSTGTRVSRKISENKPGASSIETSGNENNRGIINHPHSASSSTRSRIHSAAFDSSVPTAREPIPVRPAPVQEKRGIYISKTVRPQTTMTTARVQQPYNITPIDEALTGRTDENINNNHSHHHHQNNNSGSSVIAAAGANSRRRQSSQISKLKTDPSQQTNQPMKSQSFLLQKDLNPIVKAVVKPKQSIQQQSQLYQQQLSQQVQQQQQLQPQSSEFTGTCIAAGTSGILIKKEKEIKQESSQLVVQQPQQQVNKKNLIMKGYEASEISISSEEIFAHRTCKSSRLVDLQAVLRGGGSTRNSMQLQLNQQQQQLSSSTQLSAQQLQLQIMDEDREKHAAHIYMMQPQTPKQHFGFEFLDPSMNLNTRRAREVFRNRSNYPSAFYAIKKHFSFKKKDDFLVIGSGSVDKSCLNTHLQQPQLQQLQQQSGVVPILMNNQNPSFNKSRSISYQPPTQQQQQINTTSN